MKLWDWILIKTPENKIILIDWWVWDEMISKISKQMWFFEKRIDYIFVSHFDSDHLSWLISIMKKFEIWEVVFPRYKRETYLFKEFLKTIYNKKIPYKFFSEEGNFFIERNLGKNLKFIPIFPIWDDLSELTRIATNKKWKLIKSKLRNISECFKLEIWKTHKTFLFTWDNEENIEKFLLSKNRLDNLWKIDYLKLPHHGSRSSSSTWFILKILPKFWIITARTDNKFWHPHKEIVDRYKYFWTKLFQTWITWDLEFKIY